MTTAQRYNAMKKFIQSETENEFYLKKKDIYSKFNVNISVNSFIYSSEYETFIHDQVITTLVQHLSNENIVDNSF